MATRVDRTHIRVNTAFKDRWLIFYVVPTATGMTTAELADSVRSLSGQTRPAVILPNTQEGRNQDIADISLQLANELDAYLADYHAGHSLVCGLLCSENPHPNIERELWYYTLDDIMQATETRPPDGTPVMVIVFDCDNHPIMAEYTPDNEPTVVEILYRAGDCWVRQHPRHTPAG